MHIAALFDMDGLLIDSEAAIMRAWLGVAAQMGVELSLRDYLAVVGRSAPDAFAVLTALFGGKHRFELARARVIAELDALQEDARFPLKDGALDLLAALLTQGVPCAVASSSPRGEIEARLAAVGVWHYFSAAAGGDEVARGKPDPAVYLLAAQRLGVDASRCLAFEDSHNGARAALGCGAKVVIVPDLLQPTEELRSEAFQVLSSLREAAPLASQWFSARRDA